MSAIAYTVCASLPDEPTAREYIGWLQGGHLAAVIRGGAATAQIVRLQTSSEPIQIETRYLFPNQQVFDRYVAEIAPALRADGVRRFPPERGIHMDRRFGHLVFEDRATPQEPPTP
ncbi:MAG: DUF4286 family protein [Phycisphaeraceae bacterium]|nr:DUF4286 family protein [Phycisphaeraceae bacterium]